MAQFGGLQGLSPVNYYNMIPDFRGEALQETQNQLGQQQVIGAKMQNQQMQRQISEEEQLRQELPSAMNDPAKLQALALKLPSQVKAIQAQLGFRDAQDVAATESAVNDLQLASTMGQDAMARALIKHQGLVERKGSSPQELMQLWVNDRQGFNNAIGTVKLGTLGAKDQFAVQNDQAQRQNDADRNAETARSNRAGEAVQWANVGIAQQNANIRKAELQGKAIDAQIARETNQVKLAELQDRRAQNQREIEQAKNEKTNSVAGNLFDIGRAIAVGNELGALVNEHPTAVSRNQGGLIGWAPNVADDTRTLAAKTDEYNLKVVLPALRGTFGGNPTEGERQALMQSSNNLKKATSNKDFLNELNRTQDTLIQMQKRQIRGLGVPVTRSSDEATDTQMLLSDPSLVKEYITTHGYLPEAYYKAQFSGGK